jgi:hypothetical protein
MDMNGRIEGKVNVFPAAMKSYRRNGSVTPLILNEARGRH